MRSGDPALVSTELDWAAKHRILTRYAERSGCELDDPRVTRLALAYHDVSADQGLRTRLEATGLLRRFVDEKAATAARTTPPATTRAHLRGTVVGRAQDLRRDLTVDWVNLKLDDGKSSPVALRDPFAALDPRVNEILEAMETGAAHAATQMPAGI